MTDTMTKQQRRYIAAVEAGLQGLKAVSTGYCPGCSQCSEDLGYDDIDDYNADYERGAVSNEGSFSWQGCDICGSTLGGNMEVWHWMDAEGEIMHESCACVDCVMYLANGDLPDSWQ
jgi:hypothetical protein